MSGKRRPARVLHVFQNTVIDPGQRYLGSTKGIRCRTDYFQSRGISFDELVTENSERAVLAAVRGVQLSRYDAAVFEHTYAPAALAWVRRKAPSIRIVSSSHNAEFWHRLDILRAGGMSSALSNTWQLVKKTHNDWRCGRIADRVVCVSEWELRHYWRWLLPDGRARYMPWHLPAMYLSDVPRQPAKHNVCVCLLSTIPNPMIVDAAVRFGEAVAGLGELAPGWDFVVTGDPGRFSLRLPPRVRWAGLLEQPYELLGQARAMALLSDLGHGFKTKILEAILAGTYCIVTIQVWKQLPPALHPWCIAIDPAAPGAFAAALERTMNPLPPGDLNERLRQRAFAALDEALGFTKEAA